LYLPLLVAANELDRIEGGCAREALGATQIGVERLVDYRQLQPERGSCGGERGFAGKRSFQRGGPALPRRLQEHLAPEVTRFHGRLALEVGRVEQQLG
jgi:hypothetical protein